MSDVPTQIERYAGVMREYWRAFLHMSPAEIWAFLFKKNVGGEGTPYPAMSSYEAVKYLEENQDQREQANIEKSVRAAPDIETIRERRRRRKELDKMHSDSVKQSQEDYNKLPPAEQARVMADQDAMEQRNQLKAQQAAAYMRANKRQEATRSEPAPKPSAPVAVPDIIAADMSAYDQHEARRR